MLFLEKVSYLYHHRGKIQDRDNEMSNNEQPTRVVFARVNLDYI